MSTFFIINAKNELSVPELFEGNIIYYKKNKDKNVAAIQQDLFTKLIENGLKLKLDNFLFVDLSTSIERFSVLKNKVRINRCFLFGVSENEIGINLVVPLYKLIHFSGIDFIKSDAPEQLETNTLLKKQLWEQLQISFKLHS